MSKSQKYSLLAVAGVALWFIETAAFGWNDKPENALEAMLDFVSMVMIGWGVIGELFANLTIQKVVNFHPENMNVTMESPDVPKKRAAKPNKKGGSK